MINRCLHSSHRTFVTFLPSRSWTCVCVLSHRRLTVINLLLVLLGQFDVAGMRQASPLFGVPFFFVYIVVMFLIMMNIFLAILGEAYTVVRSENDEMAASQVQTKKRGLVGYLKLVRAVIKAKLAARKAPTHTTHRGAKNRSAMLPKVGGTAVA